MNRRGTGRRCPKTRYRRQMKRYFRRRGKRRPKRSYGQRWQAESVFSRNKRRPGSALRARQWANQKKEILLQVPTHNLLILGRRT